jgi:hypothetical protein
MYPYPAQKIKKGEKEVMIFKKSVIHACSVDCKNGQNFYLPLFALYNETLKFLLS